MHRAETPIFGVESMASGQAADIELAYVFVFPGYLLLQLRNNGSEW